MRSVTRRDVVDRELAGRLDAGDGVGVEPLAQRPDDRLRAAGAVLDQQPGAGAQRLVRQPAQGGVRARSVTAAAASAAASTSPRERSMSSVEQDRDAAARAGGGQRAVGGVDRGDGGAAPRRAARRPRRPGATVPAATWPA